MARAARGARWLWAVGALVGVLAALPSWGDSRDEASFDYFYIEANEGNSSGGHAGIRFRDHVYHFQNRDGLLVLFREPVDEFLYSYALLSNRTIHVSRIAVSNETLELMARHFEKRRRAQEAQLAVLESLRRDRELLEAWREDDRDPVVPGLGYFLSPSAAPAPADAEPADRAGDAALLVALRAQILRARGPAFLDTRRKQIVDELQRLAGEDPSSWTVEAPTSVVQHPPFAQAYSRRFADLAAGLAALDVLELGASLDPVSLRAPQGDEFLLDPREVRAFRRYARTLNQQLVDLAASPRSDWGTAFLVGMARLSALERSLANGRWIGLDSFPEDTETLSSATLARRADVVPLMLAETRDQFRDFRELLTSGKEATELVWERTEERFNRYDELRRGAEGQRDVRVANGHLVPARGKLQSIPPVEGERRDFTSDLKRIRKREAEYRRRIAEIYRYGLISRNCVSAIFEAISDTFSGSRAASEARLGGWVDGVTSLGFVPFISAARVEKQYRVIERHTIPSFRQSRLREIREREGGLWVALRESNTFTSTTYQRAARDSFFIFFTEGAPLLRPVLGTANLLAGLGESLFGFARLPLDGGETLVSGLKGALVSLPELVFANIRKGSNDWIAQEFRDVPLETVRQ